MAMISERVQTAWASRDRLALHREVEQLAAEEHSRDVLEAALEALLRRIREAGADDDAEEVVNGVWDRLSGWCHANQLISAGRSNAHASNVVLPPPPEDRIRVVKR